MEGKCSLTTRANFLQLVNCSCGQRRLHWAGLPRIARIPAPAPARYAIGGGGTVREDRTLAPVRMPRKAVARAPRRAFATTIVPIAASVRLLGCNCTASTNCGGEGTCHYSCHVWRQAFAPPPNTRKTATAAATSRAVPLSIVAATCASAAPSQIDCNGNTDAGCTIPECFCTNSDMPCINCWYYNACGAYNNTNAGTATAAGGERPERQTLTKSPKFGDSDGDDSPHLVDGAPIWRRNIAALQS